MVRDKELLKLEVVEASHTLGESGEGGTEVDFQVNRVVEVFTKCVYLHPNEKRRGVRAENMSR